jgi:hypothetical protein
VSAADASRPWRGGGSPNRFGERGIIAVFATLFAVLAGVGALIALIEKPPAPTAVCPKHAVCATPPRPITLGRGGPPSVQPKLYELRTFASSALGYRVDYPPDSEVVETATGVTIGSGPVVVHIEGSPMPATEQAVIEQQEEWLKTRVRDLGKDEDVAREILSPALGGWGAVGRLYQGNAAATPVEVAILAASDGKQTIAVSVTAGRQIPGETEVGFDYAQAMLDTLRFRSAVVQ